MERRRKKASRREGTPRKDGVRRDGAAKKKSRPPAMTLQEKVQKKLKELERRKQQYWRPDQGVSTIRILPSWKGDNEEFYFETAVHYGVGPNQRSIPCNRVLKKRCPICDRADRMLERDPDNQAVADDLRPTERVNMNIIVRGEEDIGVQVWSATPRLLQELLGYFSDADYGDFTDPQDGFDVQLRRKGEGKMNTRYVLRLVRHPSPVGVRNWRGGLKNLERLSKPLSPSAIVAIMKGEDE